LDGVRTQSKNERMKEAREVKDIRRDKIQGVKEEGRGV
jgi:hypothetical protein